MTHSAEQRPSFIERVTGFLGKRPKLTLLLTGLIGLVEIPAVSAGISLLPPRVNEQVGTYRLYGERDTYTLATLDGSRIGVNVDGPLQILRDRGCRKIEVGRMDGNTITVKISDPECVTAK